MSYPPQPQPEQTPGRNGRGALPWVGLALAVVVAGIGGWFIYDRIINADSGVAACRALRDNKFFPAATAPVTETQYRGLRGVFEDSRYEDIRDHGTKLMDLSWELSKVYQNPDLG